MDSQKLVNETLKMLEEKHIPKELIDTGYWMACPLCGATDIVKGDLECRHCKQIIKGD